jgi:hypothetical protein
MCNKNYIFTIIKENIGNDMREPENETSFDTILKNHQKYEWLKKLESNQSQNEKIEFIKNEMESAYRPFDIMAGGLYNDWFL